MPDKEGAEEKTTKSVVNKKQKQMMGEEGYDVARDMGRVRPSKDKKDATSYPPSDEVKKTQKVNKGPSALERVKADIEKRYGKGAIMDVKKEELDLTKVAEAFGGYIVEKQNPTLDDLMKQQGIPRGGIDPKLQPSLFDMNKTPVGTKNTPISNKPKRGRRTGSKNKPKSPYKQGELKFSSGAKGEFPSGSPEMGGESKKFASRNRLKDVPDDPRLRDIEGDSQTKNIKKDIEKSTGQRTREFTQRDKNVTRGNELKQSPIKKTGTRTQNLTGTKPKITGDVTGVKKRNLFPKAGSTNTPAVKKVKSGIAKRLATQTKTAQKKIIKTVGRKAATKGIAKVGGKFVAKRIPGLGAIISGAEAVGKLATGDLVGAGLAAGEGILSSIPGLGTAASTALGGYSAVRDARRAARATSTVRKVLKSTKGAKGAAAVKKAFKTSPKITKKLSPTSKKGFKGFMSKVKDPKTRIGKATRIGGGVALDVATPGGITKRLLGIGGAARPKVDGSHVGRRTAG